ncbi:putative carbonic anhydrase-like protein 2 [Trichinella nelsoni]|uniref:Putative carbonic anhydrase-like protein 2 n=1 Tax=Trichinella nelsoni TaxID=6336 RepID=A0A0V0SKB2_9BILA|nr:putative carbonic anhydrase-like protein 2 [Trichinella nelsoni]
MVMNVIRDLYPELSSEELSKISLHFKKLNINEKDNFEVNTKENGIPHVINENTIPAVAVQRMMDQKLLKSNKKMELTRELFSVFNEHVFNNRFPKDMEICFNRRLYKTAGYCKCKLNRFTKLPYCIIELSELVCDTCERIRDTLLHEMCHAAVWIIDQKIEKHGPFWKRWCAIAESVLPNMPVVKTCHEYVITTKYIYRCPSCFREVRRQTKSLNIARKVCKFCRKHFICFKLNSKTGQYVPCNDGPAFWGLVNQDWKMCSKGQQQSPINIIPNLLLYDPFLKPVTVSKTTVSGTLINTGQFLMFDLDPEHNCTIYSGPLNSYKYKASKLILRYGIKNYMGSEHTIDGETFSGEIQLYGYNMNLYNNFSEAMRKPNGIVGIAALIEIDTFTNSELRYLVSAASEVIYKEKSTAVHSLSIRQLLPDTNHYVTYDGSFTFPGCYETVHWIIMNKPVYINFKDMKLLRDLQRTENKARDPLLLGGLGRAVMPLNLRSVRTNINFKPKSSPSCRSMQRKLHYKANPWRKLNRISDS